MVKKSFTSIFLVFLFAIVASSVPAKGSDAWPAVTPDEMKMTIEPKAPGAPAIFLYRSTERDDMKDNGWGSASLPVWTRVEMHEQHYARIKVLTDAGRSFGDVEIPYVPGVMDVHQIQARMITPDGKISIFNGTIYNKTLEKTNGVKVQTKTFSFPDVQVGNIIEYRYKLDFQAGDLFMTSSWVIPDKLFTKQAHFGLRPNIQGWLTCEYRARNFPAGGPMVHKDQDGYFRLDMTDIATFSSEDYMPPEGEVTPRVDFTYGFASVLKSNPDQFWKEYGKQSYGRVNSFISRHSEVDRVTAATVSSSDSPETKLRKLYTYAQSLRNLSYEPTKTDKEESLGKISKMSTVLIKW